MLENIQRVVADGIGLIASFIPKLVLFLVIMLIGWLIAKALRKAVTFGLEKVGFERAVEKGGLGRIFAGSSYTASSLIASLVYYAILLITLQVAFGAFGDNPVSALLAGIVAFLPRIAVAVIIVVVAAAIANAVKELVGGFTASLPYGRAIATTAQVFIVALGVIAALSQIGVAVEVTLPVLVAVLATIGGILVVGVGGGLIAPMRSRWEGILNRVEQDTTRREDPTGPIPATGNSHVAYSSSDNLN